MRAESFATVGVHLCKNEPPAAAFAIPFDFGRISNFLSGIA
jgi:hypothetical protein